MTVVDRHPAGWVYEDSDWSVGLTTSGWFHDAEDCAEFTPEETVLEQSHTGEGNLRGLVIKLRYRCPCGATMEVTETSWDPDIPDDIPDDIPNAWEAVGP